jgi:uncharacterized membrane protein YqjE
VEPPRPASGRPAPLSDLLLDLLHDLPGLVSDRVELLSLELQRAGLAVVRILLLGVAAAIFAATAWLALWGGLVAVLVAVGLHWGLALAVTLILNLAAAGFALLRASQLTPLLKLPATRRHLAVRPMPAPASGASLASASVPGAASAAPLKTAEAK